MLAYEAGYHALAAVHIARFIVPSIHFAQNGIPTAVRLPSISAIRVAQSHAYIRGQSDASGRTAMSGVAPMNLNSMLERPFLMFGVR